MVLSKCREMVRSAEAVQGKVHVQVQATLATNLMSVNFLTTINGARVVGSSVSTPQPEGQDPSLDQLASYVADTWDQTKKVLIKVGIDPNVIRLKIDQDIERQKGK